MSRYAEATAVSSSASRAEIERTLRRYGATEFAYGWSDGRAILGFVLPMPDPADEEFLAHIVTADGTTIGQAVLPRLQAVVTAASILPAIGGRP